MGRPPCCDAEGVKKGPWTPEEDLVLVSYVQEHGPGNWRAVPANTGLLRCSKSCRLRWTNYLRPGIRRGGFSEQEDRLIFHLQALLGNRWAAIASYLPDRTDNDVKNYWNTHLKKKLHAQQQQQRASTRDRCGPPGIVAAVGSAPSAVPAGPTRAQAYYALSARSVDMVTLDGSWAAAPAAGRSCVVGGALVVPAPATPGGGAADSASGSLSQLTTVCSGSVSSASKSNKGAAPVAGQLLVREENTTTSAGQGEVPLSVIESWLLEDGGGEQKLAHQSLLLDAAPALDDFGF